MTYNEDILDQFFLFANEEAGIFVVKKKAEVRRPHV